MAQKTYPASLSQAFALVIIPIFTATFIAIPFVLIGVVLHDQNILSILPYKDFFLLLFMLLYWFLVLRYASKRLDVPVSSYITANKISATVLFGLLALMLCEFFFTNALMELTTKVPVLKEIEDFFEDKSSQLSISMVLMACVIAPIFEEIVCRGIILKSFLNKYTPIKAIVLSSIVFGVLHVAPLSVLSAFLGGLILGYIYYRTRNIIYPIFYHFFWNFTITVLHFVKKKYGYEPDFINKNALFLAIMVIVGLFAIFVVAKHTEKLYSRTETA